MLTFEQLKKEYSGLELAYSKNILVEYLQYELLDSIYKQKKSSHLVFIGGTAIRIVHNGNRFSEDLDFDNYGLSFSDFSKLMQEVVRDMELKGFILEFRFVEKGAFHCYIKFPKILLDNNLSNLESEKILVRIDTVKRKKIFPTEVYVLNKFNVYRNILVNPIDIALSQKLMTIIGRPRKKGRDFYDVSYLYGKTEPNFSYILKNYSLQKDEFSKKILDICRGLNFKNLSKDVEPFLIQPEQIKRVEDFNSFIKNKLN